MELKGSKTEKNLMEAFAGESMARNKYTYFASKAKKDGFVQMGNIFEETANNEKEHAKIWFKLLLEGGAIPETAKCLEMAAEGEHGEWTDMYPRMAADAKAEGFNQIAALFTMVAGIEKEHEERYRTLAANLADQKVFAREEEKVWQCTNCGFTYIGKSAPLKCPVCAHPQDYFELKKNNY
jgi:rubrerythrin